MSYIFLFQNNQGESFVIIENGKNKWIYPLDQNRKITISGFIGETHIKIEDKILFFENSPCDNKTCVASKPISKNGEWIACLPNNVIAYITSEEKNETDLTSF